MEGPSGIPSEVRWQWIGRYSIFVAHRKTESYETVESTGASFIHLQSFQFPRPMKLVYSPSPMDALNGGGSSVLELGQRFIQLLPRGRAHDEHPVDAEMPNASTNDFRSGRRPRGEGRTQTEGSPKQGVRRWKVHRSGNSTWIPGRMAPGSSACFTSSWTSGFQDPCEFSTGYTAENRSFYTPTPPVVPPQTV